tara:strand:- start:103 stop:801 length:699 start_codon:yes stop_codon:yes gene_type:complete
MPKTLIIIQARMGSKRLPGKMMLKLNNYSILEWVIKRTKKIKNKAAIIIATTKEKKDDTICKIAKNNKIKFFRGPTNDVLKRFYLAAKKFKPKFVVRICADNPFIDYAEIDLLINKFKSKNKDYACNHNNKLNSLYADGFGAEIFTFRSLQEINNKAVKKTQREHVTKYIWDNKKKFKIYSIPANRMLAYPNLKFDINTKKDLRFMNSFVKKSDINIYTRAKQIIKLRKVYK